MREARLQGTTSRLPLGRSGGSTRITRTTSFPALTRRQYAVRARLFASFLRKCNLDGTRSVMDLRSHDHKYLQLSINVRVSCFPLPQGMAFQMHYKEGWRQRASVPLTFNLSGGNK